MSPEMRLVTDQPFWLTVPEIARELRIGERSVRAAIRSGQLRAARINKRGDLRVSRQWLAEWCERCAEAAA